jgi:uncharacterized OB-fold protein
MVAGVPPTIAPVTGPDDAWFWDGVRDGRLLVRACASCGRLRHPPVPMCPACGSTEWSVREASGRGRVHAWIVSRHPTEPDAAPRLVALVELDEGVRLVSNLVDVDVADVRNELAVEVCFRDHDGVVLPQFRPAR